MKRKLAILLALAMLIVMPMTAMAAESPSDTSGVAGTSNFSQTNDATTDFHVVVSTSNISATVPLYLTFVADAAGTVAGNGSADTRTITMPTNYEITNNSKMNLKVTKMKVSTLEIISAATTAPTLSSSKVYEGNATDNVFYIEINGEALEASKEYTPSTSTWNISAKSGDTAGTLDLAPSGTNSQLDFTQTTAAKLFSVTYTIAPGSYQ